MMRQSSPPKFPNGTPMLPLSSSSSNASCDCSSSTNDYPAVGVASFNLLAPLYIRPIDQRTGKIQPFAAFDWIAEGEDSERILGDTRLPKLLDRMMSCGSDFISVQELQLERGEEGTQLGDLHLKPSRGKRSRKEESDMDDDLSSPNTREFVLPKWIRPLLQSSSSADTNTNNHGPYSIILPPQSELEKIAERNRRVLLADAAITNAIFYKSDKWSPVSTSVTEGRYSVKSTTTCVTQAFQPLASGEGTETETDLIVISSIHLDACSEEKRVQQLQRCIEQSLSYSVTPYIPPFIIAGDYNCELFSGSCINAFLIRGDDNLYGTEQSTTPLDGEDHTAKKRKECASALRLPSGTCPSMQQMKEWDELYDTVTRFRRDRFICLRRIESGCTRVAYDHDEDILTRPPGQSRSMEQWHLDHILFTPSTLAPIGYWSTLEDDVHSSTVGLPNDNVPTDHLPIAALFERRTHPQLSKEAKEILLQSLSELEKRHTAELESKNDELKQKRSELEDKFLAKQAEETATSKTLSSKKTKKKNKGKPPPEIIEHIRCSRTIIKQIKADHKKERHQYIDERTILEKMVLQHIFGNNLTCTQWIQQGRAS